MQSYPWFMLKRKAFAVKWFYYLIIWYKLLSCQITSGITPCYLKKRKLTLLALIKKATGDVWCYNHWGPQLFCYLFIKNAINWYEPPGYGFIKPSSAGPISIRDPNFVTIVTADVPAPGSAKPSAGTVLTTKLDMFLPSLQIWFYNDRKYKDYVYGRC